MNYAYLRTSTDRQDLEVQKVTILKYSQDARIFLDQYVEDIVSSRKNWKVRKIGALMNTLNPGDILIASEVTRLGRSGLENAEICEEALKRGVTIHYAKERIVFGVAGQDEIQRAMLETQIMMLGQFGKMERAFISVRTKEGLAVARKNGRPPGRRAGSKNKTLILDNYAEDILKWSRMKIPKATIIKMLNTKLTRPTNATTLLNWLKARNIPRLSECADETEYKEILDKRIAEIRKKRK